MKISLYYMQADKPYDTKGLAPVYVQHMLHKHRHIQIRRRDVWTTQRRGNTYACVFFNYETQWSCDPCAWLCQERIKHTFLICMVADIKERAIYEARYVYEVQLADLWFNGTYQYTFDKHPR